MKNKRGFTLIELMVVIAVIVILSTIALFGMQKAQASGRDSRRAQTMNGIRTALERYYADNQKYPSGNFGEAVTTLVTGTSKYLSVNPTDPNAACTTTMPATGSWLPCGAGTNPQYIYDSSATAYSKGVTAGCTTAQNCYYLWLKTEGSGSIQEFSSPQ